MEEELFRVAWLPVDNAWSRIRHGFVHGMSRSLRTACVETTTIRPNVDAVAAISVREANSNSSHLSRNTNELVAMWRLSISWARNAGADVYMWFRRLRYNRRLFFYTSPIALQRSNLYNIRLTMFTSSSYERYSIGLWVRCYRSSGCNHVRLCLTAQWGLVLGWALWWALSFQNHKSKPVDILC